MSDPDEKEAALATLGLPPDATFDQVKARFRELNDAYLKILELSRSGKTVAPAPPAGAEEEQEKASPKQPSPPRHETHTEPIAKVRARFAKGEIKKDQFEKLAKERWNYLKGKPFSELTDAEYEERIHGFDGLKFL
jgi:hypothetical protein